MDDISSHANPALQRRSQKSLRKIIEGAERVLRREGLETFSMNAVADESGMSIGGIYRRFANREALLLAIKEMHIERGLSQIETDMAEVRANLADAVNDYVGSLVRNYAAEERLYSAILIANTTDNALQDSSTRLRRGHLQIFNRVFRPHHREITHPNRTTALCVAREIIMAGIIRRLQFVGMGRKLDPAWPTFQRELSQMIITYLTAPH